MREGKWEGPTTGIFLSFLKEKTDYFILFLRFYLFTFRERAKEEEKLVGRL